MKRIRIYWRVWKTIAAYSLAQVLINRWSSSIFFLGKAIRFAMTLLFLFLIKRNISQFAGYTTSQVVVFFLTYQFIDTVAQVLFRGVYNFSSAVKTGDLDFYLAKPLNPLFRVLTGEPDLIDAFFLVPTTAISIWIVWQLHLHITGGSIAVYLLLVINGLFIATAFHILVLCLGILTTEVDNAILLYRDLSGLARFPIDIYREPLRSALFFLIPVGFMNTVPAQALMGLHPSYGLLLTIGVGVGFLALSLAAWKLSLQRYTSAGG